MKFAAMYLRQRRGTIGFFALFCLILGVTFALYHLPLQAVAYPMLLCALLTVVCAAVDMRREARRHETLSWILENAVSVADALPETRTLEGQDYQRILLRLCEERRRLETEMSIRYTDMVDYYTLWAHQIKTPIAAMRLQLQNEDSPLSRSLSSELLRIEQYVDMVLAYLRLDSASTDYVFRECDVDKIIRQSVRRFSGEFISRKLRLDYAPVGLRVVSDEKWLGFVLEQVLSNALKYTPEGAISIYAEDGATLCVRDTGIGIAPEDLPRIFENGFTGLNGRADRKASGLGLHICRRICRKLGHEIAVESELGRGTTVKIRLTQRRLEVE